MSIDLDPQEVLEHLYSLGYYNITKEQLKEFIKDLKKLIKYDLRNQERKYRIAHQNLHTDKENTRSVSNLTPTKERYSPQKTAIPIIPDDSPKKIYRRCSCLNHPQIPINSPSKIPPLGEVKTPPDSTKAASTLPSSICPECHHPLKTKQFRTKLCSPQVGNDETDAGSSSEDCVQPLRDDIQRKKKESTSVKKQSVSMKPCPSFIRPGSMKGKPPKADPVALYHYYKTLWSQHTLPGENSHEDLRWRIRHRMMAPPVITKGQSEEKVNKRPEWVTS